MAEPSPGATPTARDDRLDSWKEIAAYLSRDVTTVQRWEKREGMPVHRHLHERMGSVYAFRAELDGWTSSRNVSARREGDAPPDPARPRASMRRTGIALAVAVALAAAAGFWLRTKEFFWRSPIAGARFQALTDFDGAEQGAALSHDGRFVAFLSTRDGPVDVWITQVGSGQFHNLTRGSTPVFVNPALRVLGFSPDDSVVNFWVRRQEGASGAAVSIWSVPTLGGQARPNLEGVAESDWSRDGARLVYHTNGPGDPMFVTDAGGRLEGRLILTAPTGLHDHFPSWSPDSRFIYFVQGTPPDVWDVWRISSGGGAAERMTTHHGMVSHPVLLDARTLVYLATDSDGSGPWLYSMDVERRIPHKLGSGVERYTSLSASGDGRRLVATAARTKRTLWRLPIEQALSEEQAPVRVALTTGAGFSPRFGPGYLIYMSANDAGASIWKVAGGQTTALWTGAGARVIGAPAMSADGKHIAFSVRQHTQTLLYVMKEDGTDARIVSDSIELQGAPAWAPGGRSITSAALDQGVPHLFNVPLDGRAPTPLVREYSVGPAWTPDGRAVVYSGPDIGTTFSIRAANAAGGTQPLPAVTLTRGARHVTFLGGRPMLVVLRGSIQHKNLGLVDLESGAERPLTRLPADFDIGDFDVSPDGREAVLERLEERSDIVLLDLANQ
jgi:Tol biopolymer transport system component